MLGSITETWLLWYGLMFVALVMFKPEGLAGVLTSLNKNKAENLNSLPVKTTERNSDGVV